MFLPMKNLSHMYVRSNDTHLHKDALFILSCIVIIFLITSVLLVSSNTPLISLLPLFFLPAILRNSSTAPMHLMSGPVSPTRMASLPLRTCLPTLCYGCLSGLWLSSLALVTSWSLVWGLWYELRTTCMLPVSRSSAVSNTPSSL